MIPFKEINNVDLIPFKDVEDLHLAIKNGVLFSEIDEAVHALISKDNPSKSLNYISYLKGKYKIALLDSESYEELLSKFKEIESHESIEGYARESEEAELEESTLESFLQRDENLLSSENSAPTIQFVNTLFMQAVKKNATDIHVESYEKDGIVKFRIDGVLSEIARVKKRAVTSIINRIKVISQLDISETRIPQDGRTKITIGSKQIDIRVSILPTYYGEKAVLRLLMKADSIPSLEELGFSDNVTIKLKELLKHSYGMILITGPTGSGKSTTLYSFLKNIDKKEKNIVTVEDPVEYNTYGINQVQVNEKVGLTFPKALRSILRQDPDVILLGEIRDKESAQISVQAAMTGHLLLSTLHTNNASAAISRLVDIGVDEYILSSTLLGVLAQRLVRKLCTKCKTSETISEEDGKFFGLRKNKRIYKAVGCKECNDTGYTGRSAIGEIILMDEDMLKTLKDNSDEFFIKQHLSSRKDFISMQTQLMEMVESGETSIEEAIRVGIKEL
jgi:general secretion pathway protein E